MIINTRSKQIKYSNANSIMYTRGDYQSPVLQRNYPKTENAITLVALIITVIILVILVTVSIKAVYDSRIIQFASNAAQDYLTESEKEEALMNDTVNYLANMKTSSGSSDSGSTGTDYETLINKINELETKVLVLEGQAEKVSDLESQIASLKEDTNPAGTIISYMGKTAPEGYLFCNGSTYNIEDYPDLAEEINTEFGTYSYFGGDGTTTFAVPDLRGEFLRGTGTASRNTGSGAAVGVHQNPTRHPWLSDYYDHLIMHKTSGAMYGASIASEDKDYNSVTFAYHFDDAQTQTLTSGTWYSQYSARPTNTSVLYCIKY